MNVSHLKTSSDLRPCSNASSAYADNINGVLSGVMMAFCAMIEGIDVILVLEELSHSDTFEIMAGFSLL